MTISIVDVSDGNVTTEVIDFMAQAEVQLFITSIVSYGSNEDGHHLCMF